MHGNVKCNVNSELQMFVAEGFWLHGVFWSWVGLTCTGRVYAQESNGIGCVYM